MLGPPSFGESHAPSHAMTKQSWSRLTTFLTSEAETTKVLSFQEIERILGHALPASARQHAAFFSNTSSYSWAWRDAGREVSRRGLLPEQIRFTRTLFMSGPGTQSRPMETPLSLEPRVSHFRPGDIDPADAVGSTRVPNVLLLGCVKGKESSPQKAKDLYVSDLFNKRRRYAEQRSLPWFVLSAEHGLLRQDDWVAPYDVELKAQPASYRRAWGAWVIERLRRELGELAGVRLEIHAGDAYAEPLIEPARAAGAILIRPLQGLRQGEQLAWYLAHPGSSSGRRSTSASQAGAQVANSDLPSTQNVDAFVISLRDPARAIPLAQLDETHVPMLPGLYSWWVDEPGASALTSGLGHRVDPGLIYAGLAGATRWPSGQRSSNTIRGRLIGMHRDGSVNFSTFRQTLAVALKFIVDGRADEGALTEWMRLHLAVIWRSTDRPDSLAAVEHDVLRQLDPALNLRGMPRTDLRLELTRRRSKTGVSAPPSLQLATAAVEPRQERNPMGHCRLNVTDKDIAHGQIRITHEAKRDLRLMDAGQLQVRLRGEVFSCTYDPRFGSDQERSGLIRLGRTNLTRILGGPVELTASRDNDDVIDLT
jgi:hypothetical protein